ncbi:uncharacterized protein LOC134238664 [Saccostrea cucullata]|uniref:uncharacterized protein LOC134238664 n=1 Tax=Saccostrea cuccullata TaxID=36930 RepID=UPI002ED0C766
MRRPLITEINSSPPFLLLFHVPWSTVHTMALLHMTGFSWFCALFFELVLLIPGTDAQSWSCVTAEQCALSLERDFNETLANKNDSHVIDFCLKKTKEFRTVCLIDAVIKCEWGGNEAEYYRLQNIQKSFQLKCSELCPVMEEIKACSGLVKYNLYITKKFQEFCNSYKESVRCKENALMVDSNCTFGEKLYVQDFEADTLRVFKYICDSGCEDIDRTWAVLERCTSTYNLNNADSGCK